MKANFFIEPMRLRPACIKAIEAIKKARTEKQQEALKSLCEELNAKNKHWLVRLIRRGPAERYDLQKMIDDVEYRKKVFEDEGLYDDDIGLCEFQMACSYACNTEELCNELLSACSAARGDINITAKDWSVVSSWTE